jgi:hypothetical protein
MSALHSSTMHTRIVRSRCRIDIVSSTGRDGAARRVGER